jgi:hypothetical protein
MGVEIRCDKNKQKIKALKGVRININFNDFIQRMDFDFDNDLPKYPILLRSNQHPTEDNYYP